jgi:hypothetical protein
MSQHTSLEDEKRALLEQIHSSRETYRRMLTGSDKPKRPNYALEHKLISVGEVGKFPRSMTMRWILQHPYASAATAATVTWLGTRTAKSAKSKRHDRSRAQLQSRPAYMRPEFSDAQMVRPRTARTRSTDVSTQHTSKSMAFARSAFTGLVTVAAMILRDPKKMQTAASAFSSAAKFVQARRARHPNKGNVRVIQVKER